MPTVFHFKNFTSEGKDNTKWKLSFWMGYLLEQMCPNWTDLIRKIWYARSLQWITTSDFEEKDLALFLWESGSGLDKWVPVSCPPWRLW